MEDMLFALSPLCGCSGCLLLVLKWGFVVLSSHDGLMEKLLVKANLGQH